MNDEPKFTPGPWKAHRMRVYLPDRQNPLNVGFTALTVDNACANAALIAAAPEMYGLLARMKTELRRVEFSNLNDASKCADLILNIQKVLKKARGEEC